MIQLASDPNASRAQWRPTAEGREALQAQPARATHAWPFISRYTEKPAHQNQPKASSQHGGS